MGAPKGDCHVPGAMYSMCMSNMSNKIVWKRTDRLVAITNRVTELVGRHSRGARLVGMPQFQPYPRRLRQSWRGDEGEDRSRRRGGVGAKVQVTVREEHKAIAI